MKFILIMYLTQHIHPIILTYNQYKIIDELFYTIFYTKSLKCVYLTLKAHLHLD